MAKKKELSAKSVKACKDLIEEGAVKKDLAKSVGMRPVTLKKRLDEYELDQLKQENADLRAENAQLKDAAPRSRKVIDLKREA